MHQKCTLVFPWKCIWGAKFVHQASRNQKHLHMILQKLIFIMCALFVVEVMATPPALPPAAPCTFGFGMGSSLTWWGFGRMGGAFAHRPSCHFQIDETIKGVGEWEEECEAQEQECEDQWQEWQGWSWSICPTSCTYDPLWKLWLDAVLKSVCQCFAASMSWMEIDRNDGFLFSSPQCPKAKLGNCFLRQSL